MFRSAFIENMQTKYIIDEHLHISPEFNGDAIVRFMDRTRTDKAVLQSVYHTKYGPLSPLALDLKSRYPDRFFVFGAPDARLYFTHETDIGNAQLEFIVPLLDRGMDGIKLLEGKPHMRKAYPIPSFDSESWDPFFEYLETNGIPVTWHVNDPESHWSRDVSPWLISQGWAYDETFINNEVQYAEVLGVLDRHPNLKIIFAHVFFMSAQLDRLSSILDKYPNVKIDLTPGIEMYENFSADIGKTKDFFEKYHDRIVYGTDIGGRCILTNEGRQFNEKENIRRPEIVRQFLESDDDVLIESDGNFLIDRKPFVMHCIGLSQERLEEIYHKNMEEMLL